MLAGAYIDLHAAPDAVASKSPAEVAASFLLNINSVISSWKISDLKEEHKSVICKYAKNS